MPMYYVVIVASPAEHMIRAFPLLPFPHRLQAMMGSGGGGIDFCSAHAPQLASGGEGLYVVRLGPLNWNVEPSSAVYSSAGARLPFPSRNERRGKIAGRRACQPQ